DGYGQTETVNVIANYRCLPVRPGSMGRPVPGFDIEVVDDEGYILPRGEEGHVAVRIRPNRPVGLFKEYWRDPEATARAFRGVSSRFALLRRSALLRRRCLTLVRRPGGRYHHLGMLPNRAVRGRIGARLAPGRCRGRRRRQARSTPDRDRQGLRDSCTGASWF